MGERMVAGSGRRMPTSLRATSMRWKIITAGVLVVVALCCARAHAAPRQPTGYFVIQKVGGQNVSDAKLSSAKWDGIVIRERWSAIEPTSTTSDWTFIDQQIARAKKYKKKYVLG